MKAQSRHLRCSCRLFAFSKSKIIQIWTFDLINAVNLIFIILEIAFRFLLDLIVRVQAAFEIPFDIFGLLTARNIVLPFWNILWIDCIALLLRFNPVRRYSFMRDAAPFGADRGLGRALVVLKWITRRRVLGPIV